MSQVLNQGPSGSALSLKSSKPVHRTVISNSAKDGQRSPCRGWRLEDKALHSPLPQSLGVLLVGSRSPLLLTFCLRGPGAGSRSLQS